MIDFNQHIRAYLKEVQAAIVQSARSQNLNATGTALNSLRVVANQYLIGELRGVFYINFLRTGFTGKPRSVSRLFIDNIIIWMRAKGIFPEKDGQIVPSTSSNIRRSAFGIAKGIVDHGTRVTRGEAGIPITKILEDNLTPYLEGVASEFLLNFKDKLKT